MPNSGEFEPIVHTSEHNDGLKPKIPGKGQILGEKLLFVRVVGVSGSVGGDSIAMRGLFLIEFLGLPSLLGRVHRCRCI
jgi:hypothetical protein